MDQDINVVGVYKDKSRGFTQSFLLSEFIEEIKNILMIEEVHQVTVDDDGNYRSVPLGKLKIVFEPVGKEVKSYVFDSDKQPKKEVDPLFSADDSPDAIVSLSYPKKRGPKPGSKNKKKAAARKKPTVKKAKEKKVVDL